MVFLQQSMQHTSYSCHLSWGWSSSTGTYQTLPIIPAKQSFFVLGSLDSLARRPHKSHMGMIPYLVDEERSFYSRKGRSKTAE